MHTNIIFRKHILILVILIVAKSALAQKIRYEMSCPNAAHHEAEINLIASNISLKPAIFRMSRSSPGRYATHEFGKNVYNVKAFDEKNNSLIINRIDGDIYQVTNHKGYIKVAYTLYANYPDGTYSGIDVTNWHLNMPSAFMWIKGLDNAPIEIQFSIPKDKNWKIATQLKPTTDPTIFIAPNLQYFMDSPTKIGDLIFKEWAVKNKDNKIYTFRLALEAHASDSGATVYSQRLQRIVAEEQAVFGELPSFDYGMYTFITSINPYVKGDGMEHRNSTMIALPTEFNTEGVMEDVFAHEFFHCWNVERIRPKTLEPFNFEKSNMSHELWFAEGFTQYYGQLFMVRSGFMADTTYAQVIDNTVFTKMNTIGARDYSPIDASRHAVFVDAGVALDKTNYPNMFTSYYAYGAAVAMALDLELRKYFKSSLDEYMMLLWQKYGKSETPYTVADLQNILAQLSKNDAFADLFFKKYIYGHDAINYEPLLAPAGFVVKKIKEGKAWMGGRFANTDGGVIIEQNTTKEAPAYAAGLDIEDIVIQLDGKPIKKQEEIYAIIDAHKPGDVISIVYKHRNKEQTTQVKLIENPYFSVETFESNGKPITAEIAAFRKNWLGSKVK